MSCPGSRKSEASVGLNMVRRGGAGDGVTGDHRCSILNQAVRAPNLEKRLSAPVVHARRVNTTAATNSSAAAKPTQTQTMAPWEPAFGMV